MKRLKLSVDKIKPNPDNPRTIKDKNFKQLVQSILDFPEMLEARHIIVNTDYMILGGNMRYKAAVEAGVKELDVTVVEWSEAKQKEFIVKDNIANGDWDWDKLLVEWDVPELESYGLKTPTRKNTDLLSTLEYKPLYYEPKDRPNIVLADCVDLTKYNAKLEAIEQSELTPAQKETMRLFAYRFIQIDFGSVADYYAYCADENEKILMERLRLVLTDSGINGFIEDDLLKVLSFTDVETDNEW